nr:MAG TPA: hypothetical protein [Caudoviricetes sp.]
MKTYNIALFSLVLYKVDMHEMTQVKHKDPRKERGLKA